MYSVANVGPHFNFDMGCFLLLFTKPYSLSFSTELVL